MCPSQVVHEGARTEFVGVLATCYSETVHRSTEAYRDDIHMHMHSHAPRNNEKNLGIAGALLVESEGF